MVVGKRNPRVQVLRGIAIIAVVLIHTCPTGIEQVFVRPFLNFAVAIFLFLSGYLTDISRINTKVFYKKRITRVLVPYFIWSVIYTTLGMIGRGDFDIWKYLQNILLGGGAATMYYIPVYIQFVLLTPVMGRLLRKRMWWVGLLISPISYIYIYLVLFRIIPGDDIVASLWHVCCLGWFTFYYFGLFLGNKFKKRRLNLNRLIELYVITILLQMVEGYGWYMLGSTSGGTQLKLSSLFSSLVFIMISYYYVNNERYRKCSRLLIVIGDYSFGIYLAHLMILEIISRLFPFWESIPFVVNSLIVLALTLSFVVIGSRVFGGKMGKWLGLY